MGKWVVRLLIFVAYSGGLLLLILALLSVSVRFQDWVFRNRSERLFSDIQSIDITHTTFREVSTIFVRWDRSGGFVGPCSEHYCDFSIGISEPIIWRDNSKLIPIFLPFYRFLGGHPAIARANVNVRNGFVQAKHYSLAIEAPPIVGADGLSLNYYVEGNISTEPRASANDPVRLPISGHPEYQIGSNACLGCAEIHVTFTPSADPEDVRRLSHINFSCLTRQHPCRTKEDIMPIAALERPREIQPSHAPS
jgi:hypothetical protein